MLIQVRVVPRAGRISVSRAGTAYKVRLTQPAEDGRANAQLVETLADHFGVKKYQVAIRSGQAARNKVVELLL